MKVRRVVRFDRLFSGLLSAAYATMTVAWAQDPWAPAAACIFYGISLYFLVSFARRARWVLYQTREHAKDCACANCSIRNRTEAWTQSDAGREWLAWRVKLRLFNEAVELMQTIGALHGCWVVAVGGYARVRNPKNGTGFDVDLHADCLLRRLREVGPTPDDFCVLAKQQLGARNGRACLQSALDWMLEAKAGE